MDVRLHGNWEYAPSVRICLFATHSPGPIGVHSRDRPVDDGPAVRGGLRVDHSHRRRFG